jgi:hypothetical protein
VAAALGLAASGVGVVLWHGPSKAVPAIPPTTTLAPRPSPHVQASPLPEPPRRVPSPQPRYSKPPAPQASGPVPPTAPSEAPVPVESPLGNLLRARELLARGDLPRALSEARAVLSRHPNDSEAQGIAQKVEAALVVEQRIRNAREALRKGDKDLALEELRLGFAVNPKDQRLLDLFREATQ